MQLCPLLLQPDPLLHDQPHPAVELVQAKTRKTTTGQNDADRGGCDDGGNEGSIFMTVTMIICVEMTININCWSASTTTLDSISKDPDNEAL